MSKVSIFSPFYWRKPLTEQLELQSKYVDLMLENYQEDPKLSPDWHVHTSYDIEHLLKNKIDWQPAFEVYSKYINEFLTEFFNTSVEWQVSGGLWYTAYGPGQTANIHEHIPDHFSIVHFIKFNQKEHWPITFINPQGGQLKYMFNSDPQFQSKLDFSNQHQSLFHPRFTPHIEEGDLVIFPSQLEHMVPKSESDEIRITIAFNIKIIK